jgi:hypothetical protein
MLELHSVFSSIRDFQQKAIPYQYSTPPGEKCGLARISHRFGNIANFGQDWGHNLDEALHRGGF